MKIEVRELMDDNEMLSHVFLGCIPRDKIVDIREKYVASKDWEKESVKIPVEMKIGGVDVNPKEFFKSWQQQMGAMIQKEAKNIVAEKLGSSKMRDMIDRLSDYEKILEHWESEINWDVKNPLINTKK